MQTFTQLFTNIAPITEFRGVKLTMEARVVYSYFLGFHLQGKPIHPSYATINKHYGISAKTCQRIVKALKEAGWIDYSKQYDDSNLYIITMLPEEIWAEYSGEPVQEEVVDKVVPIKHNTTRDEDERIYFSNVLF